MKQKQIVEVHTYRNIGDISFFLNALKNHGIKYKIVVDKKQRLINYPYCVHDGRVKCIKRIIARYRDGEL